MAGPLFKNLDDPDEQLSFPRLSGDIVEVGDFTIARTVHEPGWRWSVDIRPIVGGEWCRARHVGVALSGKLAVELQDGRSFELGPDDVFEIPSGHDGYTIGNEPFVMIEWTGVRTFVGSHRGGVLTTMLFTDLVQSTELAGRLGDTRWRELLAVHYESIRSQLDRSGGREVTTTGDGVLALFDAPATAVRCAAAIRQAANRQDLHVRAGVHVGEVQVVGRNVQGLAVNEAARVMAAAGTDEILVSETTRTLTSGAGLAFEDRGEHRLKGIAEPRRLFALVDS